MVIYFFVNKIGARQYQAGTTNLVSLNFLQFYLILHSFILCYDVNVNVNVIKYFV